MDEQQIIRHYVNRGDHAKQMFCDAVEVRISYDTKTGTYLIVGNKELQGALGQLFPVQIHYIKGEAVNFYEDFLAENNLGYWLKAGHFVEMDNQMSEPDNVDMRSPELKEVYGSW